MLASPAVRARARDLGVDLAEVKTTSDRIRHAVLRDRGWNLHRIWSLDWFHRPDEQARRLAEAINAALAAPPAER